MGWYVDRVVDNFRSLLDIYVCLADGISRADFPA